MHNRSILRALNAGASPRNPLLPNWSLPGWSASSLNTMRLHNPLDYVRPRVVRIGVTGLARAGKTVLLTALAATLLAPDPLGSIGGGPPGKGGRIRRVRIASSGAGPLPRFDQARHLASLAADPPRWPERTDQVSLLALDLELGAPPLPPRQVRLELLDYPGEWLLDLPLLGQSYADFSGAVLARLEQPRLAPLARDFLAFAAALPERAAADEALAEAGHGLYRSLLHRLRDEAGLSLLQPGRFLMPAPGASPPWERFFPSRGSGGLASLMARRYDAYVDAVRASLVSPLFGDMDRLIVLADLLGALHAGPDAFADAQAALSAAAGALRWRGSWMAAVTSLARLQLPPRIVRRVAFAATKADHVAERQRGNLARLVRSIAQLPDETMASDTARTAGFAIASVRCTEDFVWSLDGHPVSAVRGRVLGERQMTRSYPGEVPDRAPDAAFWAHPFLNLPAFEPVRLAQQGRLGVPNIGVEAMLGWLLEDLL